MSYTDQPTITPIADGVYAFNCYDMVTPMLVVGEIKAMFIDAGAGNADLLQQARAAGLVAPSLPVEVALTHSHGDHIGGIVAFETCYVPEKELPMARQFDTTVAQLFCDFYLSLLRDADGVIGGLFKDYRTRVLPWEGHVPRLIPLNDGESLDLGGRTLTAYACPTHTKQDMIYVDSRTRLAFVGDAIGRGAGQYNSPINAPSYILSLEEVLRGLRRTQKRKGAFDRLVPGHFNTRAADLAYSFLQPDVIDQMLAIGEDVLSGALPITTYYSPVDGIRSYAEREGVRLYFFKDYLLDGDMDFIRM